MRHGGGSIPISWGDANKACDGFVGLQQRRIVKVHTATPANNVTMAGIVCAEEERRADEQREQTMND